MGKGSKTKTKKRGAFTSWFRLESFFGPNEGITPAVVEGMPVFIPGKLFELPVIQVPMSVDPDRVEEIARVVQEATGKEPLVITSNVRLLKLVRVGEAEAQRMMKEAADAEKIRDEGTAAGDGDGSVADGERPRDPVSGVPEGGPDGGSEDAPRQGEPDAVQG